MKNNRILALGLAVLTLGAVLLAPAPAGAADWGSSFGIPNPADDSLIGGSGVNLAVIPSVQSNSLWYVTSAHSAGAPRIDNIWFRNDFLSGTLNYYIATNFWTCSSNQPAGTNILWLSTTNSGLATNDLLVLQNTIQDSYQLIVLGGGATDGASLVYTNALGENGVKLWNTPTNIVSVGDKLWKLARVQTFTPLGMGLVTNQISAVTGDHFQQWLKLGGKELPLQFRGRTGIPSAVVMTYSNTAGLFVTGDYYVRPRR